MTPSPSAAPLPPLPDYVEEAIDALLDNATARTAVPGEDFAVLCDLCADLRSAVAKAIHRYAEEAPRPSGCVCPVERVRREVRACPVHGGDHG